jgi:hypothetical protein
MLYVELGKGASALRERFKNWANIVVNYDNLVLIENDSGLSTFRSQGANQIQIQMNRPLPTTI